jgi:LPS-assembly protein
MVKEKDIFFKFLLLLTIHLSFFTVSYASPPSTITAEHMEHFEDEDKYIATGNVRIESGKAVVRADKAIFFARASHVEAEGHVVYEDPQVLINAERAELNMDTKTGKIYKAIILVKAQKSLQRKKTGENVDFWISGDKIEKISDSHYYAPSATFTSCKTKSEVEGRYQSRSEVFGSDTADWCFKGRDVDILTGEKVTGDDVTYRIKGLPVLYFPYFRAPEGSDRQTGLLYPVLGNSTTKGFRFSPGFFWAIDENKDATLTLDYYSKRGVGEGLEYRYLDFQDKGKWYVYHLYDTEENKPFYVLKGTHNQDFGGITAFADINYVNEWDYYNQYGFDRGQRIQSYTQSSAEVSVPLGISRLYLLGQDWIYLMQNAPEIAERLPELGFVVRPTNVGPVTLSMNSSIANFARTHEVSGQRLDLNPSVSYAFGDAVRMFQSLSMRETAYSLSNVGTALSSGLSSDLHHETFEYTATVLSRLFKQYAAGTHIIEPSLSFSYMPRYSDSLPLFDSVDVNGNINFSQPTSTTAQINKTALAQVSLLNTLSLKGLNLTARVTQPYSFTAAANAVANALTPISAGHNLQPTILQGSMSSGPIGLSVTMSEDLNTWKEQNSNTSLSVKVAEGTVFSVSRYYALANPTSDQQYSASVSTVLSKAWKATGTMWYDHSQGGLRDFAIHAFYTSQCWGLDVSYERKPPDTIHPPENSIMFQVELKGLGGMKLYEFSSAIQ